MIRKIDVQVVGELIESYNLSPEKMDAFVEMVKSIHKTFKQEQTTDHSEYGQYIVVIGNGYSYEYVLRETWQCIEIVNAELY
jgi:hypothetical protein